MSAGESINYMVISSPEEVDIHGFHVYSYSAGAQDAHLKKTEPLKLYFYLFLLVSLCI